MSARSDLRTAEHTWRLPITNKPITRSELLRARLGDNPRLITSLRLSVLRAMCSARDRAIAEPNIHVARSLARDADELEGAAALLELLKP